MTRVLIVAAHPDDETIGASTLLHGPHEVTVVHVTDGAPADPRWWTTPAISREAYAQQRRRELETALAGTNVPRARRVELGFTDQEAIRSMPAIIEALAEQFVRAAPDFVVTHAYEGGHPDHDSVAFAVAVAREQVSPEPRVFEMALYHGARGGLCAGEFASGAEGARRVLTAEERRRRTAMLECFTSQRTTLTPWFAVPHECYRAAPGYDFARAPHAGPLLYERLGFPMSGAEWRLHAARAHTCHALGRPSSAVVIDLSRGSAHRRS